MVHGTIPCLWHSPSLLPLCEKTQHSHFLRVLSVMSVPYLICMTGLKLLAHGPESACGHVLFDIRSIDLQMAFQFLLLF